MPAKSRKQQRKLYAKYGAAWVKEHHYDNSFKPDPKPKPKKKKARK